LEEEAGAVLAGAAEGGDFVGFVGEGPGHLAALGQEVGGDDAVEDQVLEDGDVELAPGGGLVLEAGSLGIGRAVGRIGPQDDGGVFDGVVEADGMGAEGGVGERAFEVVEVVAAKLRGATVQNFSATSRNFSR